MNNPYQHYLRQLKERRPEIAEFILCCERERLSEQDYTAMRNCVCSLTALSKEYGATQIHKLAEGLREALEQKEAMAQVSVISLSKVLLSACHEALIANSEAGSSETSKVFFPPHPVSTVAGKPILLSVDDDRTICNMVEAMFSEHAIIITAANGKEGLEMIRGHRPDLVLLDDMMPEMTGMKLLETLRQEADMPSVIMLTSSDRPQDIERAMNAGAADYVIKPFDPHLLAQKVYAQLSAT